MASACAEGSEGVLYGWGRNAPPLALPTGVGFSVGKGTGIQAVVLQVRSGRQGAVHGIWCAGLAAVL